MTALQAQIHEEDRREARARRANLAFLVACAVIVMTLWHLAVIFITRDVVIREFKAEAEKKADTPRRVLDCKEIMRICLSQLQKKGG